jgi:DNA-directed RNA polymerase, mitochondrial
MLFDRLPEEYQKGAWVDEEQLEMHSLDMGIARYRDDRFRQDASFNQPEQKLIASVLDTLIDGIERLQEWVAAGKPAKGVTHWGYPFLSIPADRLAFLTLAELVNNVDSDAATTVRLADAIGKRAEIEREFLILRQQAPDVYERVRRSHKNWTRRAHRTAKTKVGGLDTGWTTRTRVWLGMILLESAITYTKVFRVDKCVMRGKTKITVSLQPEVRKLLEQAHSSCELLRPFYLPMIVPPARWTNYNNGGYQFHRVPFIKPSPGAEDFEERKIREMPQVYEAVNHIQHTEWRINGAVYEVLRQVWEAGGGWAGLPELNPTDPPPPDFNWDSAPDEQRAAWKLMATRVHDGNARMVSIRKSINHQLWIAKRFLTRPVLYFPHQCDWRGRVYPMASHLHPQGDDTARSLLQAAEGKVLGERGVFWLKVHLANCYGYDKVSYDDRVQWCDSNMEHIRQSAEDPINYRWWAQGDKPWQTLAACLEVATATPESITYLPIQKDGSCNGLQHFSAMGLDEVGARAVNLIPSDSPNDVYQQVADRVNALISSDLANPNTSDKDHDSANAWRGRITRDVVKRATMTIVYGLTKQGMQAQFIDDGHCDDLEGPAHQYASYLRDKTWSALEGVLSGASAIMEWLRDVARRFSLQGYPVRWVTPVGFLVIQEYVEQRTRHIYTSLQKLTIREPNPQGDISTIRQVRGLPPNFVHSFDAAHLMLTVNEAVKRGIGFFSLIHDSYGTLGPDVDLLDECIRDEFVTMYKQAPLALWHRVWGIELAETLPSLPEPGQLDLEQVKESKYFFN